MMALFGGVAHAPLAAMRRDLPIVAIDETLDNALEQLTSHHLHWAPVGDRAQLTTAPVALGMLSIADVVNLYRGTARKKVRHMQDIADGKIMVETTVEPQSPFANQRLGEVNIPEGCVLVSIRRGRTGMLVRATTVIKPGDMLTVLVEPQTEASWQASLGSQEQVQHVPESDRQGTSLVTA